MTTCWAASKACYEFPKNIIAVGPVLAPSSGNSSQNESPCYNPGPHLEDGRVEAAPEGVLPVWPELAKVPEALPGLSTDLHKTTWSQTARSYT